MSSESEKGKPVLPQGWVIRQSKTHPEKVYYFNTITGSSTWDRPRLIAKADSTVCSEEITGESSAKKSSGSKFLVKPLPSSSDITVTSSVETKEEEKLCKLDIKKLEKKKRAIMRQLLLEEAPKKHVTKKALHVETEKKKKYVLKRNKGLDVIIHKRTCKKFKKENAKSEAQMFPTDVEMLDISKEIIPLAKLKSPVRTANHQSHSYYIVVDTNILIHDLKFVDELKDKPLQGHGPPVIVVPWIVIQELDAIKGRSFSGQMNPESSRLAGEAIKFLNTMLMAQHPRIRGQTCTMAQQDISAVKPKCNDDKVLHCCLQLIEVSGIPRERVVLLTNDKNLCNKAIISEIKAHTTDSILNDFQVDFSPVKKPKPSVYSAFANFPDDLQLKMIAEVKAEVDTLVCQMKVLLKKSFGNILESAMKSCYGELWLTILLIKPPWSFLDIIECFKRHWFAVFSFIFSRNMLPQVEILRKAMRETKGYVHDEHQAAEIIAAGLAICLNIENKYEEIPATVKELRCLQEQCEKLCQKTKVEHKQQEIKTTIPKDVQSLVDKQKKILMVFQQTWARLNNICGTALDSLGQPHSFKYEVPSKLPSKTETIEFLEKLYVPLRKLTHCMYNVIRPSNRGDESLSKATMALFDNLTSFLPGLDLSMPTGIPIELKDLHEFCQNPEKKELLTNGNSQLLNFYNTIHHCLSLFSDIS